jgi:hypothetical protein
MAIFVHRVLPNGPDVYFEADDTPEWDDVEVTYDVPNSNPPKPATIESSAQWARYDVGRPPAGAIKGTIAKKAKPPPGSKTQLA